MPEYRALHEADREVFFEYANYAFRPENGAEEYDPENEWPDLDQYNALYAEDPADERPLSICGHFWFDARVRGDFHPMPGLTAVASPPERRYQGLGRRMLEESLTEYRDRGAPFTFLWPFRTSYYRRYGWEVATELATYECPPSALSFAADATNGEGRFRPLVDTDEHHALARIYDAYAERYALSIDRDEEWWRKRMLESENGFIYVWERHGEPRGYLQYDFDGGLGERTMRVRERAFTGYDAYQNLLRFCQDHESQVETIRLETPADDDLLALVDDPEDVTMTVETGPMARIVDVADALSTVRYPNANEQLTVSVRDPLVDWNHDTFRLAVDSGTGQCTKTTDAPEARIDIGALSQLVVGYRSARTLERTDRLETDSTHATNTLERLFPPTPTYFRDKF